MKSLKSDSVDANRNKQRTPPYPELSPLRTDGIKSKGNHIKRNHFSKTRARQTGITLATEITSIYHILFDTIQTYIASAKYAHLHDQSSENATKRMKKSSNVVNDDLHPPFPTSALSSPVYLSHGEMQYLQECLQAIQRNVENKDNQILEIDRLMREEKQANIEIRKLRKELLEKTLECREVERNECARLMRELQTQEQAEKRNSLKTEFLRGSGELLSERAFCVNDNFFHESEESDAENVHKHHHKGTMS